MGAHGALRNRTIDKRIASKQSVCFRENLDSGKQGKLAEGCQIVRSFAKIYGQNGRRNCAGSFLAVMSKFFSSVTSQYLSFVIVPRFIDLKHLMRKGWKYESACGILSVAQIEVFM